MSTLGKWMGFGTALAAWCCSIDSRSPGSGSMGGSMSGSVAAGAAAMLGSAAAGPESGGAPGGGASSGSEGLGVDLPVNVGGAGSGMDGSGAGGDDTGGEAGAGSGPVAATLGSCPAFTPCGGQLVGAWSYVSVCVDPAQVGFGEIQSLCPEATLEIAEGDGASLVFTTERVARAGEVLGLSTITFPNTCVEALFMSCSTLEALLEPPTTCAEAATACACSTPSDVDFGNQAFTANGTQLSLEDGRTFDYCIDGDRLTYREAGDALEAGIFTLQLD